MLILYFRLVALTRHMARFQGPGDQGYRQGFLYLPKEVWNVMGRPERIVVEVNPEEE
jgi:hypothetical protein